MAKAKKATKKFQRKLQKGAVQKHKRFHKGKALKDGGASEDQIKEPVEEKKVVEEMSMDEFLDGGFDQLSDEEEADGEEDSADDLEAAIGDEDTDGDYEVSAGDGRDETDEDDGDLGAENEKLKSEISSHKRQLEALKEKDPEFYAYLQATDKGLLDFDDSGDEDGDEESAETEEGGDEEGSEEEAEEEEEVEDQPKTAGGAYRMITSSVVEAWCAAAREGKLRSIGFLLQAYRSACHFGDQEEADGAKIASSKCFNAVMLFVLKEIDGIFRSLLSLGPIADDTASTCHHLQKTPKWKKILPLAKSYLGNSLHLLSNTTDPVLIAFILRCVRYSMPMLGACDRLQKKFIKVVLGVFSSSDSKARVQSILFLRQAALHLPSPAMDTILKGAYKAFASNAKFVNAGSVPHISFMASCIAELWSLDPRASYVHAFTFIRQLAVTMRNALNTKTRDAFLEVYCWQYVNCLELWAKVLAAQGGDELRPLVYPVAQLLVGAVRLLPTPRYFPLRLRLMRSLVNLSKVTGYFIPTAPLLLEVLQWSELSKKPASSGRLPNLALQLRVSKTLLRSSVLQEEVVSTVMELLSDHLAQWSEHVAFPEVVNTTCVALRRFIKTSAVERFRRAAKQVLDAVDKTATQTRNRRNSVEFSPKDLGLVADFMKEGQKGQQNPLRRLAAELAEKGKQRRALATTAAVDVGDGDEDGSGPEDDEIQIAPDENGYDDSGDDGEEGPTNNAEAFKKPLSKSLKLEGFADGAGDADELRDFELSDDDDSDPDLTPTPSAAPKTKKGSGMMEKAKRSQDTGNHSGGIRKPSHHPKGKGKPGRGQVGKGKGGKGKGKGKGGGKS